MSLRQLTAWCDAQFGAHPVSAEPAPRPFDIPWIVLDHGKATRLWRWRPQTTTTQILQEIADHARAHSGWLDISAPL
jgi:CDP-paratose 2-epimerase